MLPNMSLSDDVSVPLVYIEVKERAVKEGRVKKASMLRVP
jgi:hypothetical protein